VIFIFHVWSFFTLHLLSACCSCCVCGQNEPCQVHSDPCQWTLRPVARTLISCPLELMLWLNQMRYAEKTRHLVISVLFWLSPNSTKQTYCAYAFTTEQQLYNKSATLLYVKIRYDTIEEFNVDSKAEYSALSSTRSQKKKLKQTTPVPLW